MAWTSETNIELALEASKLKLRLKYFLQFPPLSYDNTNPKYANFLNRTIEFLTQETVRICRRTQRLSVKFSKEKKSDSKCDTPNTIYIILLSNT